MARAGPTRGAAVIAFLVIGGVGVLLLLVSLMAGDVLDGALDFGGDLVSGAALAGLLGAFGFAGALAFDATGSLTVGIVGGLVVGVAAGLIVGWASSRLRRGGDEGTVRTADLPGREGAVVSAIPDGGLGEVSVVVAGHMASIDRLTVVSTDGAGQLPRQVTTNIVQTMELLKNTTGVDLEALLSGYLTDGRGARGSTALTDGGSNRAPAASTNGTGTSAEDEGLAVKA